MNHPEFFIPLTMIILTTLAWLAFKLAIGGYKMALLEQAAKAAQLADNEGWGFCGPKIRALAGKDNP